LRTLIVNADDFGFTSDVNDGIVHAHRNGILTATTLMATGAAFEHAAPRARETPGLDVGCHLALAGGRSVAAPFRDLPRGVPELLLALVKREIDPCRELRAQIRRIVAEGIQPTHLDTHKHTHLAPALLDAVARLAREYQIPWVRRPFDFPLTGVAAPLGQRLAERSFGFLRRRFHRVLERHGCRTTDHFAGFQMTGRFRAAELAALIRALPEGITEFMCHPGFCREELRRAATRLKESREEELRALTAPEARQKLEKAGVRLASYRDLARW
jgi:predicted glycoside hydrolase/deacetylase ChbG (UPF0249 family)